jgi:putative component of membrane protein insertase Oxa1/YidC/SpoIIIJ protein YidD
MRKVLIIIIDIYKILISSSLKPLFGNVCKFEISCSEYTKRRIREEGVLKGLYLGLSRLSKCYYFENTNMNSDLLQSEIKNGLSF